MNNQAGAPSYPVLTGRRDGFYSSEASVDLPSSSISWEAALTYFQSRGLDVLDMATLLGTSYNLTSSNFIIKKLYLRKAIILSKVFLFKQKH